MYDLTLSGDTNFFYCSTLTMTLDLLFEIFNIGYTYCILRAFTVHVLVITKAIVSYNLFRPFFSFIVADLRIKYFNIEYIQIIYRLFYLSRLGLH